MKLHILPMTKNDRIQEPRIVITHGEHDIHISRHGVMIDNEEVSSLEVLKDFMLGLAKESKDKDVA